MARVLGDPRKTLAHFGSGSVPDDALAAQSQFPGLVFVLRVA